MRKISLQRWAKSYGLPLIAGTVLLAAIAAQSRLVNRELEWVEETKFGYLPELRTVRLLTPGHQITAGRLWWIRAATYFGGEVLAGREARWMIHLSSLSAKLDPKFEWPYVVIGTSASDELSDTDLNLLWQGAKNLPKNIHIHLFLAMRLVEKHGDYKSAVEVLDRVMHLPETPDFMRGMRETYRKNQNDLPQALAIYLAEWERAKDNPGMAQAVLNRLYRVALIKKNQYSQLTYKRAKALGEQLQKGELTMQQFYGAILDQAFPPPPLVEEEQGVEWTPSATLGR